MFTQNTLKLGWSSRWFVVAIVMAGYYGGCGSVPQPNYYTLNLEPWTEQNGSFSEPFPCTIGLAKFEANLLLSDDRLIYRENPYEVKFWHYQRWIAAPHILVTEFLGEYLKLRHLVAHIVKFPSNTRVNYVLGGKLLSFEEWDRGNEWFAKVAFEIYLKDMSTDSLVWRQKYEALQPVGEKMPAGVVAALSQALSACFERLTHELNQYLTSACPK